MSRADRRSVGELLAECDTTTRRLLIDPDALDAAAMVRTWPEVVQAAHELLDRLPTPSRVPRPGGGGGDLTGERLHLLATALDNNLRQRIWPGAGPADDQLLTVAGNLQRAHDLVHRHLSQTHSPAPAVLADAVAARTRVLHTLYVGSHAVALAIRAQLRDAQDRPPTVTARHHRRELNALHVVQTRLAAFEQVAGAEVYRTFPAPAVREHHEPPAPDRLRTALAGWDIEAHRALVRQPSMANLAELTRVQATTLALTRVVLNAAAAHHVIDAPTHRAQLEPRLTAAESAWGALHGTLRDLTGHAHRQVSTDLRSAGAELVHALAELVLDGTVVANPATIAARVDLTATTRTLIGALGSPHQISLLMLDAALDPRTRVSARAAQRLLSQLAAAPDSRVIASLHDSWVDPRDLAAGRDVAAPAPIRKAITQQVKTADAASHTLAAASTTVNRAATAPNRSADEPASPIRSPLRPAPGPALTAGTLRR